MACCAFAVFILGQIVFAFGKVRVFLFGPLAGTDERTRLSAAAGWRLDAGVTAAQALAIAPARLQGMRHAVPRALAAVLFVELLIATGGLAGGISYAAYSQAGLVPALVHICRGGGAS